VDEDGSVDFTSIQAAGAGAELDMYLGAGTPIQDAICGVGAGIRFMCMWGRMLWNVDVGKGSPEKFMRSQPFIHIGSCLNKHETVLCSNGEVIV